MTSNCSLAVSFFARQNNPFTFPTPFHPLPRKFLAGRSSAPHTSSHGRRETNNTHRTHHYPRYNHAGGGVHQQPKDHGAIIKKYEEWLKEEKNKFVGLDLEYTCKSSYVRQGIAVVQLSMREHVLVYHYCRSERSQALLDFLQRKAVTFTSVDTRSDKTMLARAWIKIPDEHHVDI